MPKWILEKPIRLFWLGAGVAGGLWLLWAIFGAAVAGFLAAKDMAIPGQWGDTFGALNALFSALGFAAIFATLVAQQGELRDQKDRSEQAERERHVERFESSLMGLLRLMRELRKEIQFKHSEAYNRQPDADRSDASFEGALALKAIEREVTFWVGKVPNGSKQQIAEMYEETVHKGAESTLSPFFRVAYTILRNISEDKVLSSEQKASYGNLVRAQMTSPELTIAGINGLHAVSANFAKFLTEFRMFKYLPEGVVKSMLQRFYAPEAFLGRE